MYFPRTLLIPCKPEDINETIYKIVVTRVLEQSSRLCLINLVLAHCVGTNVLVDKRRMTYVIYLCLCKAFDTVASRQCPCL